MNTFGTKNLCIYVAAKASLCSENETAIRAEFSELRPNVGEPVAMGESIRWAVIKADLFDSLEDSNKFAWVLHVAPILDEHISPLDYDSFKLPGEDYTQAIEVFLNRISLDIVGIQISFSKSPMEAGRRFLAVEEIEELEKLALKETEWLIVESEKLGAITSNNFDKIYCCYCDYVPLQAAA